MRQSDPSPSDGHSAHVAQRWLRWLLLLGVLLLAGLFVVSDLGEMWRVVRNADPRWVLAPGLLTVATYVAMTLSYDGIAAVAGYRLPFWEMFRITLVANAVNYMVSTGGLSGFAARMYFFTQRSIPSNTAVVISLAQTFLTNLTLLVFVVIGFVGLLQNHALQGSSLAITTLLLVLVASAVAAAMVLLFDPRRRRRTLFCLGHAAHWVMYRLLPHRTPRRFHIWRYQKALDRGIQLMLSRPTRMIGPVLYILLDWLFTILILYTAFRAVGHPIHLGVATVGFAVGMALSLVSLVPGGLGVMEGSMALVFRNFDVPLEAAVVAVLIFRLAYYVLPVVVSLFFFHPMLVQGQHAREEIESGM